MGVMSPLDRFSVIPYFIDPVGSSVAPASKYQLNHQQAHDDALRNLPSEFGSTRIGLHFGQNLIDYDLANPASKKMWEFYNHIEHYIGGNTILPNAQFPPPAPQWAYPFW